MKLLTPKQTSDIKGQETAREILRTQEIHNLAEEERRKLTKAEMEFEQALAGQRARWAMEELEHSKIKKEMQKEIEELERKKLNALIPVDILEKSATEKLEESEKFLKELQLREKSNEETAEILQDRLDEVGEREQTVIQAEKHIKLEKEGIERQKEATIDGIKNLNEAMQNFAQRSANAEKDIEERKKAIFIQDRSLNALKEQLEGKEKELNAIAIRLRDERGVLDRAFKEVERMKLKYNEKI